MATSPWRPLWSDSGERWGGPAAYLPAHGRTTDDIEALRNRVVEH